MSPQPHMLIMMTDQQRADCLRCAGHPQIETPNMDRIAREGTRFAQATTVSPICMPARASFATGLYPHEHGMWRNAGALALSHETLYRALQRAGYFTALVGKAHHYYHRFNTDLRQSEPFMHALGFEYVYETAGSAASVRTASYVTDEWERRGLWEKLKADYVDRTGADVEVIRPSALPVDEVLDSHIGRKAVAFVDAYADARPMCLFVGFAGPHEPWDAPGAYASMYRPEDTPPPIPVPAKPPTLPDYVEPNAPFRGGPPLSPALVAEIRANYYGKISLIDFHVGRILEAFERKGWLQDLLIVFLSDHGEMLGDHGRFRKGYLNESCVRIPLLIRWPGRIPSNSVTNALVENIDVLPTLVETAGGSPAAACRGRSLWPLLRGEASDFRDGQLSEIARAHEFVMFRTREYKLAIDETGRAHMLFDLALDPAEQRNLVGDATATPVEGLLRRQLQSHLQQS